MTLVSKRDVEEEGLGVTLRKFNYEHEFATD